MLMIISITLNQNNVKAYPRIGEADLVVAKNRNGPTATVTVAYQYHYCRFVNMVSE